MNPNMSEQGKNFSVVELGPVEHWRSYTAKIKALPGMDVSGKLFLNQPDAGAPRMSCQVTKNQN